MAETLPPLPNRIPGTAITGNHRGTVPLSNAECCRQANKEAKNNRIPEGRQLYEKGWENIAWEQEEGAVERNPAYLIELFGMFGVEKTGWEWRKAIGMAVAIAGIVVFKWE